MSDATTDLTPRGPTREGAGTCPDTVAIGYATTGHLGAHGIAFLTVL